MADSSPRIVRAWLTSLSTGVVEFDRDWKAAQPPSLSLGKEAPLIASVVLAGPLAAARAYAYRLGADGKFWFVLPVDHGTDVGALRDRV